MIRALTQFGVRNPVVANLVVFVLVGAGLVFGLSLRREFFPEVRPNQIAIGAPYPGASPDEIERSLVLKIEDAIDGIDEIDEINTTITEGSAGIRVQLVEGVNISDAVAEFKRKVDALTDLPERSERIVVSDFQPNLPTVVLNFASTLDEAAMKRIILSVRDDLESLPNMGDVSISGTRPDEITVSVLRGALLEHDLSLPQVSAAIRSAMTEVPGGTVRTPTSNITLRTIVTEKAVDEIEDIIVKANPDGTIIRLSQIATVKYGFADVDLIARFNGKPAVSVTVFKVGDEDAIDIAEMVKAYAAGRMRETLKPTTGERIKHMIRRSGDDGPVSDRERAYLLGQSRPLPPNGEFVISTDLARFIQGRLDLLSRNALWGGVLVLLTLFLLLNTRVAFWVTAGLIVSIFGTLAFMSLVGITLNLLTMFGLIIVIGLLVDDAIVVAENIASRCEAGEPALIAAVNGTRIVGWPVVATVLTTVFAFSSLTLIEGQIGDLLGVLPKVVVVALGVSLLEALFILPVHVGHSLDRLNDANRKPGRFVRAVDRFDERRTWFIQQWIVPRYLKVLHVCLRYRVITLMATIALLIASFGMIAGGRLGFTFLGEQDAETLIVDLRMPVGTPLQATDRVITHIENVAGEFLPTGELKSFFTIVGARGSTDGADDLAQPHLAQIWLELPPGELRDRSSDEISADMRVRIGELPGIKSLSISAIQGGPEGPDLSYTIMSNTPSLIDPVVEQIKALFGEIGAIYDIADDADLGQRELRIEPRAGARALGLEQRDIATQVRAWVYGLEAYTFASRDEDVDVRVALDDDTRHSLAAIESLHVFTPAGKAVPISEVATITEGRGQATIRRLDRQRAITVNAEVDASKGQSAEAVARELSFQLAEIESNNPGVRIIARGRQKEVADSFATLPLGILASATLIYVTLAWLFGSYIQPIIVLCAVPFALIGMIWGHILLGFDLTMLSLIGFIGLTGVVVNDALIFIEFYNHKRQEHIPPFEAAIEAGRARFRAILLTTLTTVLGLSPLMLEQSFQAKFLIPMAITISFGLISATFIVLLVTPCLLLVLEDVRGLIRVVWTGKSPSHPSDSLARAD